MTLEIFLCRVVKFIGLLEVPDNDIRSEDIAIHIGAEEGKLLQFLMRIGNAKNIVEIGTHAGYSTIWLARSLPDDGVIYTIEHDAKRAERARNNFAKFEQPEKIILIEGDAIYLLESLEAKGPFDAIFIDANKSSYNKYLDFVEKNVKKNGLIIADNTLLFGAVYGESTNERVRESSIKSMQEFNNRLADSNKYLSILVPTDEGMTLAMKLF
jgi:predicted O-methyltransferase YrrM